MYTHLVPDRRIRATIKPTLGERNQDQYVDGNHGQIQSHRMPSVAASGDTTSSPTLISRSGLKRKQCPLYSVNSESSLLGCVGSESRQEGLVAEFNEELGNTSQTTLPESETGQSRSRGHVRCQSLFIARERRRCEPGSNSVIVTIALTSDEGHVVSLGGLQRVRKIFAGCPAIRPIWDQSPGSRNPRFETVGNRLYPLYDQDCLRRFTAEAQIQDRSRKSTGLNTAPGFLRVKCPFREAQTTDDGGRKPKRPQTDRGGCPRALPRHSRKARLSRAGGNPEKTKHATYPLRKA